MKIIASILQRSEHQQAAIVGIILILASIAIFTAIAMYHHNNKK